MTVTMPSGEVAREQARKEAIMQKWGTEPPEGVTEFPTSTGYVLVLSGEHTVTIGRKQYYLGIDPNVGWVRTTAEVDTEISG
jgi:hypothetical protein